MARHTGPVCRLCRREGIKLYLKGDRCYTDKCGLDRRGYVPGEHGQSRMRRKVSEYGLRLREKQRARRFYGLLEQQFRRYYHLASQRKGVTGENLLMLLESRLDNVVYRTGLASSRKEARQLVRHGHFAVNGRKVNIPSYRVRTGETVSVRPESRKKARLQELAEVAGDRTPPEWLSVDLDNLAARVERMPHREEIDVPVQEHLIVELYSK